jgi:hypothetical protein
MLGLLVPFLLADIVLGWMLVRVWRSEESWLGGRRREHGTTWWVQVARLAGLLALSLTGTAATLMG